MSRSPLLRTTSLAFLGALALALLPAAAEAQPAPHSDRGRLHHFELRAGPAQVAMVPLGEGDRTDFHLRVSVSVGALQSAKYHGACGRVLLHGSPAQRISSFAPTPSAYAFGAGTSRVCGEASCGCSHGGHGGHGDHGDPNMIHVHLPPTHLVGDMGDTVGRFVPVLPGGDTPQPTAEDPEPGCFGWIELVLDTTGLPTGTQIVATVASFAPGVPTDGPPTQVDVLLAAAITP